MVGWKPHCCLEKVIKREKKKKYIVCLVVKGRNKVVGRDWKGLVKEGTGICFQMKGEAWRNRKVEDIEREDIFAGTGS